MQIKLANENAIIMIDDDEVELLVAQRYLKESNLSNELIAFTNPLEFLEYINDVALESTPLPAAVLIDARMPKMNGWDLIENIRSRPQLKNDPVLIMFSNSDEPADMHRAINNGADAYIVKPSSGKEYIDMLNSLMPNN